MSEGARVLIPAGTVFAPDDITFFADREHRSLEQAIAEADVLVSAPHAGSAIPAELDEFLAPEFTRRLQFDYTDVATEAIVRRWAEIDPRIVAIVNPHPRMVRDPNRARPDDIRPQLREAFARVAAAGPMNRVDLSGVDPIRPVTFSFFPLIRVPANEDEFERLAQAFETAAAHGLRVYEDTRDRLLERFVDGTLRGERGAFTTLSFHDTMNTTTRIDGAVNVPREEKDELPPIVSLSNRGDLLGEDRGVEGDPVTMDPELLRELAEAHRIGFGATDPGDVLLNKPYLGSQEITQAGALFRTRAAEAAEAGVSLSAVQAEFLREYLLGEAATAVLHEPGTGWVEYDPAHIDALAHACRASWDAYRAATA
ncbi:N-formylglutamate amidohydrolase [Protaetiibacter larvae]|uniref:N-formylglutamate amidohydrolase n=1 Tax=Protaetiibacter larvae TaxID=2592654 RepID=A0A5C1Y8U4_9MICO|nr:N-formylglutamate amidohydrolase [Protaetiibacter larvae]QEO09599.1 N-formylglutamate amidohydrolase [Protaetiibacter larvae]